MSEIATEEFVTDYAVQRDTHTAFSLALDDHTETAPLAPLGANLNLSELDPEEREGVLQLRLNALEAHVNNQAGLINTLIGVLRSAGLAD